MPSDEIDHLGTALSPDAPLSHKEKFVVEGARIGRMHRKKPKSLLSSSSGKGRGRLLVVLALVAAACAYYAWTRRAAGGEADQPTPKTKVVKFEMDGRPRQVQIYGKSPVGKSNCVINTATVVTKQLDLDFRLLLADHPQLRLG